MRQLLKGIAGVLLLMSFSAAALAGWDPNNDGVAVFTQTKGGLMFDVSVGGQKFTFEPR